MTGNIEKNLASQGIVLPQAASPAANYVPYVISGKQIAVAGQIPFWNGELTGLGKVGRDITTEDAANIARICGLNLIGLKRNKIKRDELNELRKVFKYIFFVKDKTLNFRVNKVKDKNYKFDSIKKILNFIDGDSKRSFCLP